MAVAAIVVVVAVAGVLIITGHIGPAGVAPEDLTRVLLVGAAPDENGDVVAQIVAVADVSGSTVTLEAVSPSTSVTIPGTTYDTLADAYPFGGGGGVADALARITGDEALPYVALDARTFAAALEQEGSVALKLPAPMSVFDGEELFTISSGTQDLTPAEVAAVFKGAPYLEAGDRTELDSELAALLARLVRTTGHEAADTDLAVDAYEALTSALGAVR